MKKLMMFSLIMVLSFNWIIAQSYLVNVNNKGVMLDGYDVVALQSQKKAVSGSYEYQAEYNSAIYTS